MSLLKYYFEKSNWPLLNKQQSNQIVVTPAVRGGRSNESEIMTNEIENTDVLIYDVAGRVVKTLQWDGKFSDSDIESLKNANYNLPTGVYIVLVRDKTNRKTYKLFIQ